LVSGVEPLGDLGAKVHISSPLSIAVKCRILKRTRRFFLSQKPLFSLFFISSEMKNLLLASIVMMCSILHAQIIPYMGMSAQSLSKQMLDFSLYAKDYPGMTSFQFSLLYDPAKMIYIGADNPGIPAFSENNFSNTVPGIIRCSWFDFELEGQNITDSTTLIQLTFFENVPGGSSLCFSNEPLPLEFSQMTENGDIKLTEINLYDACNSGLVLLSPSAIEALENRNTQIIYNAVLSQNGEMTFSLGEERNLSFTLYDLTGNKITQTSSHLYAGSQSTFSFGCSLANQVYIIKVKDSSGLEQSVKAFAK